MYFFFQNIILPRSTHLRNLFLYGQWPRSKLPIKNITAIVDPRTIKELNREEYISAVDFIALLDGLPNLQCIKTSTNLLGALNSAKFHHQRCLHSFIIDSNNYREHRLVNIEPFCYMFPRIQHLIIAVHSVDDCQYIRDQSNEDLISVIVRISTNDNRFYETEDESGSEEGQEENSTVDLFSDWIR